LFWIDTSPGGSAAATPSGAKWTVTRSVVLRPSDARAVTSISLRPVRSGTSAPKLPSAPSCVASAGALSVALRTPVTRRPQLDFREHVREQRGIAHRREGSIRESREFEKRQRSGERLLTDAEAVDARVRVAGAVCGAHHGDRVARVVASKGSVGSPSVRKTITFWLFASARENAPFCPSSSLVAWSMPAAM
jgi:hypothetical protein